VVVRLLSRVPNIWFKIKKVADEVLGFIGYILELVMLEVELALEHVFNNLLVSLSWKRDLA
jgi:hypothetical protein